MEATDERGEFLPNQRGWLDDGATRQDAEWQAEKIRDFSRQVYRAGERYRLAEAGELERLQPYAVRWTGEIQQRFESADFRHVGDFEDVVLNGAWPRTLKPTISRVLLDRNDGATTATLSAARLTGLANLAWLLRLAPRTAWLIDLETELSDGRFVVTSNLLGIDTSDPLPGVVRRQLPPKTSVQELLFEHRRVLAETLAATAGLVAPRPVRSLVEAMGMQQRLTDLKAHHRDRVGHLTPGEVRRNADGKVDRGEQLLMEAAEHPPATSPPKPPSVLWAILVAFAFLLAAVALLPLTIVRGVWRRLGGGQPTTDADHYQHYPDDGDREDVEDEDQPTRPSA